MYINKVIPYIMATNALEAIEFYKKAFGATVDKIQYGDAIPGMENNLEAKKTIIHAPMTIQGNNIFLADATDSAERNPTIQGNNVQLCILYGDKEKQKNTYEILKGNGSTIIMELMDTFWGDTFAIIKDKYGVTWQLTYNEAYKD